MKSFTVKACVGDQQISIGTGATKKAAEQEAAYKAILVLKKESK